MAESLFLSPKETAKMLSASRASVYRLLASGSLAAKKLGRRTLVDVESIKAYAASLPSWVPGDDR